MSDQYFPIRLNTLRPDDIVNFDVFLKVGDRMVHYIHQNDLLEGSRFSSIKAKGVRKLFIKASDEDTYLRYLEQGLHSLSNPDIDLGQRAGLAHDSLTTASENAETILESQETYESQKQQLEMIKDFLASDTEALKAILKASGISEDNSQHSATVSSLCLSLAIKMGIQEEHEIFELGLAALFHDIGKSVLKFDYMKPMSEFTPAELKQYKNHPEEGVALLAGKPFISPRILGLIASHEERGEMRGYPEKKNLFKMDISYQILSLANCFDHFCWEKKLAPKAAVPSFLEQYGKDYDEKLLMKLDLALA